ncbi:hypothetical protein H6G97_26480 [Nostoc flagelliforme FACHB-838]|uniref:Uncharacterized protein n=1 Tax=Nostoc flagelliforme FACHB-838 TaxID=2692904 RepID=A0ABR8DVM7_9NOSO|nr:hypothetical protein [Nostoc flagelliforme]MBD2532931.1 hypothetical protein [Nostoc flagelliforme FACHB-838]
MQLGYFQKDALIEKLAKKFYAIQGYVVPESYRMQSATHPAERACVAMAIFAVEEFELINDSSGSEDDDEYETDCLFPEETLLPGV